MTETPAQFVYVVDDDDGVRESLSALLESVGIKTRAFDSAEASLQAVEAQRPVCMLVDVRMPGIGGLELQRLLKDREKGVPVVMITGHGDISMAVRAMKEGAIDFLEKPFNEQELIELVQKCQKHCLAAEQQRTRQMEARYRLDRLTNREREVMRCMINGKSSKQIAVMLELSPKTVDVHRSNIMRKVEVKSVAELVHMCLEADASGPA
jgi:two-component system, LuxR family, response regulator FixJ